MSCVHTGDPSRYQQIPVDNSKVLVTETLLVKTGGSQNKEKGMKERKKFVRRREGLST